MKAKVASKILQDHLIGKKTPVSENMLEQVYGEAKNSGLKSPFTVLAVNWDRFIKEKVKTGHPNKLNKIERNELGNILQNSISKIYYREVPCFDVKQSIDSLSGFTVEFQDACKTNPAFVGDVSPEVTGAPADGTYRGVLKRNSGEEINNAMVILSWHWMGGENDNYEVTGYVS
jgi:hypothetical protein